MHIVETRLLLTLCFKAFYLLIKLDNVNKQYMQKTLKNKKTHKNTLQTMARESSGMKTCGLRCTISFMNILVVNLPSLYKVGHVLAQDLNLTPGDVTWGQIEILVRPELPRRPAVCIQTIKAFKSSRTYGKRPSTEDTTPSRLHNGHNRSRPSSNSSDNTSNGDNLLQMLARLSLRQENMLNQMALDPSFILRGSISMPSMLLTSKEWNHQYQGSRVAQPLFQKLLEELIQRASKVKLDDSEDLTQGAWKVNKIKINKI